MAWYDAQIIGVIVGGSMVGFWKLYYDYKTNNRLKVSLERGIKSEVRVLKDSVDSTYNRLSGYRDGLLRSQESPNRKFRSLGEFRLSFTEANLDKIGIIDENILDPLMELKATLDILPEGMKIMLEEHDRVVDGKDSKALLLEQMDSAVATFNRLGVLCDKILKHKSQTSALGTMFIHMRNVLETIYSKISLIVK